MAPLIVTVGDPAGIGPDIALTLNQLEFEAPIVIVADKNLLLSRAGEIGLDYHFPEYQAEQPAAVSVLHQPLITPCQTGTPNPSNGKAIMNTLLTAANGCLSGEFSGMVTGPINKALMQAAGYSFYGHTDWLESFSKSNKAVMMFVLDQVRLALLTAHIPLKDVAKTITQSHLQECIMVTHTALIKDFNIAKPRLLIAGLNPHAGEQGTLGNEEIKILQPTLETLRQQNIDILGPVAADSIFHIAKQQPVDAIISLYHDQSLPVLKAINFNRIVNVTLGLPFIRTSVDHGTAYEIAGSGKANATSLHRAIQLAIQLGQNHAAT